MFSTEIAMGPNAPVNAKIRKNRDFGRRRSVRDCTFATLLSGSYSCITTEYVVALAV